jgi:hypothetical protein
MVVIKDFEDTFKAAGTEDLPESTDYVASHLLGEGLTPELDRVDLRFPQMVIHHQGKTMHCTAYGLTHCVEILNSLEHQLVCQADPEEQWINQCSNRNVAASVGGGDSLQNALKSYMRYGLTNKSQPPSVEKFYGTGYARVENTVADMEKWLARGFPIYTGSGNHCYAIIGYDRKKQVFIALNSYGPKGGTNKDGTFDVKYSDFSKLFSKYIIYDKQDVRMIFRDVSEKSPYAGPIEWCLKQGIMKGYDPENNPDPANRFFKPDQPVTRAELAQVIFNALNRG